MRKERQRSMLPRNGLPLSPASFSSKREMFAGFRLPQFGSWQVHYRCGVRRFHPPRQFSTLPRPFVTECLWGTGDERKESRKVHPVRESGKLRPITKQHSPTRHVTSHKSSKGPEVGDSRSSWGRKNEGCQQLVIFTEFCNVGQRTPPDPSILDRIILRDEIIWFRRS